MATPEIIQEVEEMDLPIQEDRHESFSVLKIKNAKELEEALTRMDSALAYIDEVRNFVIKRTKPNDWTDQSGNPYFGEAGCNRFAAPFQLFEKDVESWTIDDQGVKRSFDEKNVFEGKIVLIMFHGTIGSKLLGIEASFEGGSRLDDGFKSKDDILFYSMKAKANWRGRGFRKILGMENLTWADLVIANIKPGDVKKVDRQTTAKAETKEALDAWNILLELNEGDAKRAEDYLFKMTNSDRFPGKRRPAHCSQKQLDWILPKLKTEHAAKFPDRKPASGATANEGNGGVQPGDDTFRTSVDNLRPLVSDADYHAVLTEFGVTEPVELAAAKRQSFLLKLGSKRKGGQS